MTEPLNRDDIIELLNRLGSDADEDVLDAARQAHAKIAAAGVAWDDLLVSDQASENETGGEDTGDYDTGDEDTGDEDTGDEDAGDYDTAEEDTGDEDTGDLDTDEEDTDEEDTDEEDTDEEDSGDAPAGKAGDYADSRKLIDELLAKPKISANLRDELKGYKTDIAEGEFNEADRRYLNALQKRLSK